MIKHPKVCKRYDCPFNIPPSDPAKFGRCKILERKERHVDAYLSMSAEDCLWAEYPEVVTGGQTLPPPKPPLSEKLFTFKELWEGLQPKIVKVDMKMNGDLLIVTGLCTDNKHRIIFQTFDSPKMFELKDYIGMTLNQARKWKDEQKHRYIALKEAAKQGWIGGLPDVPGDSGNDSYHTDDMDTVPGLRSEDTALQGQVPEEDGSADMEWGIIG